MKLRSVLLGGTVLLGLTMIAAAGSDNAKKLVGVWEVTKEPKPTPIKSVEFAKDGVFKMTGVKDEKALTLRGTYKLTDDIVTITGDFGGKGKTETNTLKIKKLTDDVLHLENDKGMIVEFKRGK